MSTQPSLPSWKDLPREQIGAGGGAELIDELLALILAGKKTASTGALSAYTVAIPKAGDRCVLLDGAGRPRCVIEDEEVFTTRFDDVPEAFALLEGEGDYGEWRMAHVHFFAQTTGSFSPDMMVVCERYRVVEIIAQENAA